jgi:hypothetical protein
LYFIKKKKIWIDQKKNKEREKANKAKEIKHKT